MTKKIILIIISITGLIFFLTGCSGTQVQPSYQKHNIVKPIIPYKVYQKGLIISQMKVLIDKKYETLNNKSYIPDEKDQTKNTQKTLFKTVIISKGKEYTIFIDSKLKIGSFVEFILEKNKITNLTI